MPDSLESGKIYVSMEHGVAIHMCCCGCGNRVVTPIAPSEWQLTYNGKVVSLTPSIGNWSFPCRSHYWLTPKGIRWAEQWSDDQIARNRAESAPVDGDNPLLAGESDHASHPTWWQRLIKFFGL
ncbi:MAG: hypothetical protein IT205_00395 [Fimbriimonadaceae bacterium]|jgi:hypothetical protein|nr:hypothetical protein [Fimbriimonadaceae bacterium]